MPPEKTLLSEETLPRESALPVAPQLAEALAPFVGGELPVRLEAWDGSVGGAPDGPRVRLNRPEGLRRLLWSPGELGAAQAYVSGDIDIEGDVGAALSHVWSESRAGRARRALPSPAALARAVRTLRGCGALGAPLPPPPTQARVRGRMHSMLRDRSAISHHYDLSNDFYALVLDPSMAYSCAWWTSDRPDYTLADAQRDKLDLVCRKVGLERDGDDGAKTLLDVGCGWGSLSLHAASEYGAHVTGITISREQKAFIDGRIAERGLGDRVRIEVCDYRELEPALFDAVASLEMGEHVGQENYPRYARSLAEHLRPGGCGLVQQMSRRGRHPGGGPFIESFIAPDMYMRPTGETLCLIEDAGLEILGVQGMREHYVRTVDAWIENFEGSLDAAVDLVGEQWARVWRLYLAGGRLSFAEGRMGVDQIQFRRPD